MKKSELMNSLTRAVHKTGFKIKKHSPEILVTVGVIGTVASAVMACKATLKASEILEDAKLQLNDIHDVAADVEAGLIPKEEYTPEEKKKEEEYKKEQEYQKMNCGYKCPNCGAKAGHKIGAISKGISIGTFGIASDKVGKTYKCEKCGYLW